MTNILPKPDYVELPDDKEWRELSSYQRWYYKNRESEINRKNERRKMLQDWLQSVKDDLSCEMCGESHNACIDFHHTNNEEKDANIGNMPQQGYSKDRILAEIEKCEVLCANCHRKEHYNQKI